MGGYDPEVELMSDRRTFRAEMTAARLDIARLQAEVERLKLEKLYDEKAKDRALLLEKHSIRDTAWNDAIEAAANEAANWWAYLHDDQDKDGPVANAIRALKRT